MRCRHGNGLRPEYFILEGGGALQRDVQAVGVLFLGLAAVAMLANGSVIGLLVCYGAIRVLLKAFRAP